MQITVEKPSEGLEHKMLVTMPSADLDGRVEKRLTELQRTVRIDGFRKGKVPLRMVKQQYGGQAQQEMLGETLHHAFFDAVEKEKLEVAGYPNFEEVDLKDGEIKFTAKFEVYPEVSLPDLSKVEVEKIASTIKAADKKKMIDRLREQQAEWVEGKAAAKDGDRVNIDFVGSVDGEEFEGGKAEGVPLALGSGQMIPGFEDGIIGMKKGEEKVIEVTFPEEYQAEHLAGKKSEFKITLNSIETKKLPKVDETFIKSLGVEEGTDEAFDKEITENMERELKRAVEAANRAAAFEALSASVEITLPQALIAQESEALRRQYIGRMEAQGMPAESFQHLTAELFSDEAEKRVRLGLIIGEVIKAKDIKATDEAVDAYIAEQAASYEDVDEVKNWYKSNPDRLAEVRSLVVEAEVSNLILSEAKVKEVKKNFDEVVVSR